MKKYFLDVRYYVQAENENEVIDKLADTCVLKDEIYCGYDIADIEDVENITAKTYVLDVRYQIQVENELSLNNALRNHHISTNEYYSGYNIIEIENIEKGILDNEILWISTEDGWKEFLSDSEDLKDMEIFNNFLCSSLPYEIFIYKGNIEAEIVITNEFYAKATFRALGIEKDVDYELNDIPVSLLDKQGFDFKIPFKYSTKEKYMIFIEEEFNKAYEKMPKELKNDKYSWVKELGVNIKDVDSFILDASFTKEKSDLIIDKDLEYIISVIENVPGALEEFVAHAKKIEKEYKKTIENSL